MCLATCQAEKIPASEHGLYDVKIIIEGKEVDTEKFLQRWQDTWRWGMKQGIQDYIESTGHEFESRMSTMFDEFTEKLGMDWETVAEEYGWTRKLDE